MPSRVRKILQTFEFYLQPFFTGHQNTVATPRGMFVHISVHMKSHHRALRPEMIFLAVLLVLLCQVTNCAAHSFLIHPEPYSEVYRQCPCLGRHCRACPGFIAASKMKNTKNSPAVTWQRGQTVQMRWAKNNHGGGFIRFSIIPTDRMFDPDQQRRYAFFFGCWQQGELNCKASGCGGGDKNGWIFTRNVTIPNAIPDGRYIFSMAWYGGVQGGKAKTEPGYFSDYYSCSYIEISGGRPITVSFQPTYNPGISELRGIPPEGKCLSSVDDTGICTARFECQALTAENRLPLQFQNGKNPPVIPSSAYLETGFEELPRSSCPKDIPSPRRKETPASPETAPPPDPGICNGNVCCLSSCGTCGGTGCGFRPGGPVGCCGNIIGRTNRDCARDSAPCIIHSSPPTNVPSTNSDPPDAICHDTVCCLRSCGICAGEGCDRRPGGHEGCCRKVIEKSGRYCSQDSPPCIKYTSPPVSVPNIGNHDPPDAICNSGVCCLSSCGTCAGEGCAGRPGGYEGCCNTAIYNSGKRCSQHGAPCIRV